MATKTQKTKVGIFLIVSAAVFAAGILLISGAQTTPHTRYHLEFEESVLGLGVGGLVEYLGVPVGSVEDIYVDRNGHARVTIRVNDDKVELREGVTGNLVLYSIAAGTMAVHLEGGEPDAPILPEGATIPTRDSLFANFTRVAEVTMNKLNGVLDSLGEVAESVNMAMRGMDEGVVAVTLAEVRDIASEARIFVAKTNETLDGLETTLNQAIGEYTKLGRDLQFLTEDVGKTADDARAFIQTAQEKLEPLDLGRLQDDLDSAVENFNTLMATLTDSATELNHMAQNVGHDIDNVEYSLRETLQSARAAFDSVNALAQQLQQDPAALIRGRGRPRE